MHEWPERFDPDIWLEYFSALRLRPGYKLDFVYYYWGNGGHPLVYARPATLPRLADAQAYSARYADNAHAAWRNFITFTPDTRGAFEIALLVREVSHFYGYWHNTDESEPVLTRARLAELRAQLAPHVKHTGNTRSGVPAFPHQLTQDEMACFEALADLDPRPTVKLAGTHAEVRRLEYSPAAGFCWIDYRVELPNRVRETGHTMLLRSVLPPKHF